MGRNDFDPESVRPDGRAPRKSRLVEAGTEMPWRGSVNGDTLGAGVTILAYGTEMIGAGPRLHVHPYDETFILVEGRARFFVGNEVIDAERGEVVFAPLGLPHRFENTGPGRLQTIDIHHSPRWIQTDLD